MKWNRLVLSSLAALLLVLPAGAQSQQELVFVGSGKKNIEAFRFDLASGALTRIGVVAEIEHPSFLAVSRHHQYLYAVSEGGPTSSSISAYGLDTATGKLSFLNKQSAGGSGPCYVDVDFMGKNALVANYGSGSFATFPLSAEGLIQPMSGFIQDHGASVNRDRQEGPHAHCLVPDPYGWFVYGCDLGLDKVLIFKLDYATGALVPNEPAFAEVKPGSGPRHIAFHPNGKWAFVINEMASTITAFGLDLRKGALREIQTISTLPVGYTGENNCAEIAVHPDGKFVYGSNRGDDSIVAFACDEESGKLTFIQRVPSGGKTPRQFEIDPTGRYLLVGNQNSDTVVVFSLNPTFGSLRPTGTQVQTDNPQCVRCVWTGSQFRP
jgi:6-phosphogluconolactonase